MILIKRYFIYHKPFIFSSPPSYQRGIALTRKSPVRHVVASYKRDYNGPREGGFIIVRSHVRGHGTTQKSETKPQVPKYLKGINITENRVSEKTINLMKKRLNDGKAKISDLGIPDEGLQLDQEQTKKGYEFLINQWKSPTGKERANNPFGYREEETLKSFKGFRLIDFYDTANYHQNQMGMHFYVPYYRVVGAGDAPDFEYAYYGGQIHIMG